MYDRFVGMLLYAFDTPLPKLAQMAPCWKAFDTELFVVRIVCGIILKALAS